MNHDRIVRSIHPMALFQQGEMQIAVLTPGGSEPLVETANGLQHVSSHEAVRGDELGVLQPGRVSLVVGRPSRQGHDHPARDRRGPGRERGHSLAEPVRIGDAIVVGESDDLAAGDSQPRVTRGGRAMSRDRRYVTNRLRRAGGPPLDLPTRELAAGVVGHDDLIRSRIEVLCDQRLEAPIKEIRPQVGRHDNRGVHVQTLPSGFSSRNEPMTRASSGEVQNDSTASRGLRTIGSPRVLNDVFTSTGTPVRT